MSSSYRYFNTEAVVLNSRPQGEFGAHVVLATPQWGLLQVKMSGVRRGRSRLKVLKEAGIWADVNLYGKPGQNQPLSLLTGKVLEHFGCLRGSLERLRLLFETLRFSEIFFMLFDSRSADKFGFLTKTLEALDNSLDSESAKGLVLSYKLKILDLSGWRFSANPWAVASLDAKMLQLCKNLETGPLEALGPEIAQKLRFFMDLYVESLIGKPV